ncbi:MAG: O-antigen ligase family protein [Vampirovibrionales bacterium]
MRSVVVCWLWPLKHREEEQTSFVIQWGHKYWQAIRGVLKARSIGVLLAWQNNWQGVGVGLALLLAAITVAETSVIGALCALMGGLALLAYAAQGPQENALKWTVLDGWLLAFTLTLVVATAWSSVPESWVGLLKALLLLSGWVACRLWLGRYPVLVGWVLGVLMLLGGVQAGVAWQQLHSTSMEALATWQDPNLDESLQLTRVYGTLPPFNPNLLAGFLIPCWGGALGIMAWKLLTLQGKRFADWFRLFAVVGWVAFIAWALVATGSRGGYLALAAMGVVWVLGVGHWVFRDPVLQGPTQGFWLKRLWLWGVTLVVAGVALMVMTSEKLWARLSSIGAGANDSSIAYRFHVYQAAWQMIQDHWWVGIGPGNLTFQAVYGFYMTPGIFALGAYSVPLEVWIEQGLLGLMTFAGWWLATLLAGIWLVDHPRLALPERCWALGLTAAWVGQGVYGVFDTVWYRPAVYVTTGLVWAALAALVAHSLRLFEAQETP